MAKTRNLSQLARMYVAYRRRSLTCSYPPSRVWVEPTSHCNLHCSFCGNKDLPREQRGFMDIDLFQELADEAAGSGIRQFNLFHRGESLLHPELGRMIRYAAERSLRTRIHTNGTLLSPALARELISSGLDVLSFSFDGYDKEMYDRNRPGAGFDRVIDNIMGFLAAKREMASETPFVALELMEISDDPRDVLMAKRRRFLTRFDDLPLDKFIIRRPHNWAGLVDTGSEEPASARRVACPLLWHALVVFWDGRVLPCPQDFFGTLQLGDVHRQTLMEIWNGEAMQSLRREMSRPSALTRRPCADCDRMRRTTIAGVPLDYLGRFMSENVFDRSWLGRILPH